ISTGWLWGEPKIFLKAKSVLGLMKRMRPQTYSAVGLFQSSPRVGDGRRAIATVRIAVAGRSRLRYLPLPCLRVFS
ncbi:MAG: hypothetical protein AAFN08_14125, partial [Cyanobacteria bacterium J06559_3]